MSAVKRSGATQLPLEIPSEREDAWVVCRGVFSAIYLLKRIGEFAGDLKLEDVRPIYGKVRALWEEEYIGLCRRREAYTRTQFLEPVLSELGWHFIPEQDLPSKAHTRKRPDYCLFLDAEARRRAAAQTDTADVFRESATVLEAKKVQNSLDEVSDTETPGWFPSQQVQDYLHKAKDATGQRFFNWAILTNGNEWRLYCEQAPTDAFFAIHLAHGECFCTLGDFRLFCALFRAQAFDRERGLCLLDQIRVESLTRQAQLESNLRRRIFGVLEDLANGFRDFGDNRIAQAGYGTLYDNALIFLYRLLFVLYAESRGLLPVRPSGYGSSKVYREKFSLARLVGALRSHTEYSSKAFTELYDDLLKLFHLINGDKPDQNRECKVPRYNGGLFDPRQYPLIEKWRVNDLALGNVLRQLLFAQPPARGSARQQEFATEEAVDYGSLEVRQLGDIYEGLLGAHLEQENGRLALKNLAGKNHNDGIFYTPDWVVRYLVRETLVPLTDQIEASAEVRGALKAKAEDKRRDNSFALGVLKLNVVDPAMGSGHFLVRTTEHLAKAVFEHPTTRRTTEQIIPNGNSRRSREDILKDGRIPVPTGFSQEQAELAYWRRRVVEACIYGVDINPLAVELAKLSLWLTCIAVDEPLNFLDHHLRVGNSLLWANVDEMHHLPTATAEEKSQAAFNVGPQLRDTLRAIIAENVHIEEAASTEMELVKAKEARWKTVRQRLEPFLYVANVWVGALDGLPVNDLDYRTLGLFTVAPGDLSDEDRRRAKKLRDSLAKDIAAKVSVLTPFHWQLEFPDVFFETDGRPRPEAERGFDAVLGNPPYVSTHTGAEQTWRNALEKRAGYLEDLYLHFTERGFQLLRRAGGFGLIVSDTFFTLASKLRMRELLQAHSLTHLGQCDPFEATVDAALFVARKGAPRDDHRLVFIQARPRRDAEGRLTEPEGDLPTLKPPPQLAFTTNTKLACLPAEAQHGVHGCLRVHRVPLALYQSAHKQVFFEPRPQTLRLFDRFNEPVRKLVADWWDKIETSRKCADNLPAIRKYLASLKPGEVSLVGLVAEGGQGLATANNARFLGYLADTPPAVAILAKRERWTKAWLADPKIKPVFLALLKQNGGDPGRPTKHGAAWEACIEPLKAKFSLDQLGFNGSDLYRIVPPELIATPADFNFTWRQRKAELWLRWRLAPELAEFWGRESLLEATGDERGQLKEEPEVSDEKFCQVCQQIQEWIIQQNAQRGRRNANGQAKQPPIRREVLGLRSSENYADPADAPRIATIYNGLSGRAQFVSFRKGDPEGNRWLENEPLYIDWSDANVVWLFANSGKRAPQMPVMRNPDYFLREGVSWTRGANHVPIKAKVVEPAVLDVNAMKLSPTPSSKLSAAYLLVLFNSDIFSFFLKKFIAHTWMAQISDMRMMPLVIPTLAQEKRLKELAERAIEAKRLTFAGAPPPNELAACVRRLSEALSAHAPSYLRPPAQLRLLSTAADCLGILELAVNWEAEKLYGGEGQGPFDEF